MPEIFPDLGNRLRLYCKSISSHCFGFACYDPFLSGTGPDGDPWDFSFGGPLCDSIGYP